jgi:hypothetical protein
MHDHNKPVHVTVHPEIATLPEAPATAVDLSKLKDAQGREFTIKAPDILAQARFERVFGGENASYRLIMGALTWVRAIDGENIAQPTSVLAYEALLQRVGEQALEAIVARIGEVREAEEAGEKADLKNLSTSPR